MKILFVSSLIATSVIHRLVEEGNEVKLAIQDPDRVDCLGGFVEKVDDWKQEVEWVGKDGLIIFDDVDIDPDGDRERLRKEGYSVFGGDRQSDKLELDRQHFQDILSKHNISILPSYDFISADDAINFVNDNPDYWVLKQNTHFSMLNYVGQQPDGRDVLMMLEMYKQKNISPIQLQKRVVGVEIGVGRYFNGKDWVGPIEVNLEHKSLCNDDLGPLTAEMGTLTWYEKDENFKIYVETLAKLKPHLKKINYKGDIDINCIVNEKGIWPLEATPRFGMPAVDLQSELHKSSWAQFLKAIADGEEYELEYNRGYGIVVSVMLPPFPYAPEPFTGSNIITSTGTPIFFRETLTSQEKRQIHFEEVSKEVHPSGDEYLFHSGKHGFAFYVTGQGKTVKEAQNKVYSLIEKIHMPKMFYRTDIGNRFIEKDEKILTSLKLL